MSGETVSPLIHQFVTSYFTNCINKVEKEFYRWYSESFSPVHRLRIPHPIPRLEAEFTQPSSRFLPSCLCNNFLQMRPMRPDLPDVRRATAPCKDRTLHGKLSGKITSKSFLLSKNPVQRFRELKLRSRNLWPRCMDSPRYLNITNYGGIWHP